MNSKLKKLPPLLLDWFSANARDLPWRKTRDPYAIWVSEIMLQQTQVKTVMPYWERWMRELPTIESVAAASPDKIHKLWEGLGYYTRARNLQKAAQEILRRAEFHDAQTKRNKIRVSRSSTLRFPETFEEVLALPGIGRYTAGAICSIAFNQATPILDGNVIRVLTRIFGIAENPKEKKTNQLLWQIAEQLVSHAKTQSSQRNSCSHLNQSLMELGALICTPRNPQCNLCPVKKHCVAYKENRIEELPNLGKREAATARHFVAFVVERNGKFLVRQRPEGIVNAHLWEFPNVEIHLNGSSPARRDKFAHFNQSRFTSAATIKNSQIEAAAKEFGFEFQNAKPLRTVKHSITRYRITLEAFHVELNGNRKTVEGIWRTKPELQQLAFSSAHKKILIHLSSAGISGAKLKTTVRTPALP
ncbi:MAG TPA: A/G-specific adenine glycosylase [Verrucomicrobiae bacterium]|nr:A/G-specific adenine glycosylase [Verrucomicrobiae bacterium]